MNKPTIAVGAALLASTLATAAVADMIGFDTDAVGSLPAGWVSGVTGKGSRREPPGAGPHAERGDRRGIASRR